MNSVKVIKFPSHYSSSFLQIARNAGAELLWRFLLQGLRREVNIPGVGEMKMMVVLTSSAIYLLCFGLLMCSSVVFFLFTLLSLSLSLSFSFFSRLLSYVLLSLLSSLVAFLVSYALPPSVFFSLRSPLPLFFLSSISLSFFFISCSLSFSGFYRPGKALRW